MSTVRTTCPSTDNKYYLKSPAGYNKCILGNAKKKYNARPTAKSVLPNCVGYAYGRYLEYWDLTSAPLPTCNAKDWDNKAKATSGLKYSKTPEVGSVIVFEGTSCGHVAFVERIESNGDLYLSESNWGHQIFRNVTVKKANSYNYSSTLKCVGFVCNPNAAKTTSTGSNTASADKAGTYKVTSKSGLNCRKTASIKAAVVTTFIYGAKLTITETKTADGYTWGKCSKGWVALKYCEKV